MNAQTQIANHLKIESTQIKRCEEWAKVWFVVIAGKGGRFVSKSVVTAKAQIISISLERWENGGFKIYNVATWQEANALLSKWASSITHNSHENCKIIFAFSDSDQYEISFDLDRSHSRKVNLAQELMSEIKFMSGDCCPSHMTQENYQEYLKTCQVNADEYQQLIQKWEIPA